MKKVENHRVFFKSVLVMFCVVNSSDWNWKNEKNNFCLEIEKKIGCLIV